MGLMERLRALFGKRLRNQRSRIDERFDRWSEAEFQALHRVLSLLPEVEPSRWDGFLARVTECRDGHRPHVRENDAERLLGDIGLFVSTDFSGRSAGFRMCAEFDPAHPYFGFCFVETFVGTLQGVLVATRTAAGIGILRLRWFDEHGETQKERILGLLKRDRDTEEKSA